MNTLRRLLFFVVPVFFGGCVYNSLPDPVDCSTNPVILQEVAVSESECGGQTGSLEVLASGGTNVFRYRIGSEAFQTSPEFSELAGGTYEVTASDENNCFATIQVLVGNKDGVNLQFTATDAGCKSSNGTITATALNGTGPFTFKLNESAFSANNTFTGLSSGTYSITVKDATGCESSGNVIIKSGVSYQTDIAPIIQSNCAVNGCHNGSQFPDFRVFKNIQDNAARIKTQTGSRIMPLNGSLSQAQINAIACWVDDGAPAN
jgi:hypothetical protein